MSAYTEAQREQAALSKCSHKVREEAALILAISASNPKWQGCYTTISIMLGNYSPPETSLDSVFSESINLAYAASQYVFDNARCWDVSHADAEAEALIRAGWEP